MTNTTATAVRYFIAVTGHMDEIHGIGHSPAEAIADAVEQSGIPAADLFDLECTEDLFWLVDCEGGDVEWTDDPEKIRDVVMSKRQRKIVEKVIPHVQAYVIETARDGIAYNWVRAHGRRAAGRACDECVDGDGFYRDAVVQGVVTARITNWMFSTQD